MPKKSGIDAIIKKFTAVGNGLVSLMSGLLAAVLVLYSGYVLYDTMYTRIQAESAWDLMQYRPEIIDDGSVPLSGSALAAINEDYRAWLTLYDTQIDYPVMQGANDLYYASHDVYKKSSLTGAIYLAAANSPDFSDSYNLIYGHHMDGNVMFGTLDHYTDETYLKAHRDGVIVTREQVFDIKVFAVMLTDAYATELYAPGGDQIADVLTFLREGIGEATVWFDNEAAEDAARIVALSTCESAETDGRLVVFARMDPRESSPAVPSSGTETPPGNTGQAGVSTPSENTAQVEAGISSGNTEQTEAGTSSGSTAQTELITDTEEAAEEEYAELKDAQTPLASFFNRFQPTGGSFGERVWALLNLICLLITLYLLLPLLHLKAKFRRKKQMQSANEQYGEGGYGKTSENEKEVYKIKPFVRRFRTGMVLEILVCVAAVIIFILTEDMRLPMVLIDRWTPLMIVLLLICWILDVRLIRYRSKEDNDGKNGGSGA